jgi:hypothetical protein
MTSKEYNELNTKIAALIAFVRNVGLIGKTMDVSVIDQYKNMYADIKQTLNDPNLETYALNIPYYLSGKGVVD